MAEELVMKNVSKILICTIILVLTTDVLSHEDSRIIKSKSAGKQDPNTATKSGRIPKEPNLPQVTSRSPFVLRSPVVADGGNLPKEFTGDGAAATLPLEWIGAPAGTKNFAVIMHHVDPEGKVKWYWILYNIPANVQSLPKNVKGVGILGNNSVNGKTEYAPPHSKGPGPKTYVYTVYALSASPRITVPPSQVNREVILTAMKGLILASAELRVVYNRSAGGDRPDNRKIE